MLLLFKARGKLIAITRESVNNRDSTVATELESSLIILNSIPKQTMYSRNPSKLEDVAYGVCT